MADSEKELTALNASKGGSSWNSHTSVTGGSQGATTLQQCWEVYKKLKYTYSTEPSHLTHSITPREIGTYWQTGACKNVHSRFTHKRQDSLTTQAYKQQNDKQMVCLPLLVPPQTTGRAMLESLARPVVPRNWPWVSAAQRSCHSRGGAWRCLPSRSVPPPTPAQEARPPAAGGGHGDCSVPRAVIMLGGRIQGNAILLQLPWMPLYRPPPLVGRMEERWCLVTRSQCGNLFILPGRFLHGHSL